jgi:hypothetical protein
LTGEDNIDKPLHNLTRLLVANLISCVKLWTNKEIPDTGKPVERRRRKAMGLKADTDQPMIAKPPKEAEGLSVHTGLVNTTKPFFVEEYLKKHTRYWQNHRKVVTQSYGSTG